MEQLQSKIMTGLRRPGVLKKIIAGVVICVAIAAGGWLLFGEEKAGGDEVSLIPNPARGAQVREGTDGMDQPGSETGGGQTATGPAVASERGAPAAGPLYVDVAGAVAQPRVVMLPAGSRVYEAIEAAGGLTAEADLRVVNRAMALSDGDKIYVPTKKETSEGQLGPGTADPSALGDARSQPSDFVNPSSGAGQPSASGGGQGKVNINTADAAGLQQLSGVGPAIAGRIVDYRAQNGAFRSIDDLKKVSGIGPKTFEKLKDGITV